MRQSIEPMSWYSSSRFAPYVSVAQRRANAAKHAQKLAKKGQALAPVTIEGRAITTTFWGKAWCAHLESFSDYANRLPRGRSYVRNGSVIDLQIAPGKIIAQVMGSSLYEETIVIKPLPPKQWAAIKAECAGKIDSLVGLLQGRLSDGVMRVITDREKGLFPAPTEIELDCSCPDWADMCKHIAAVLYGVGARLDAQPELLFVLRGVDHLELIGAAADAPALAGRVAGAMDTAQMADVFGIEIDAGPAGPAGPARPVAESRKAAKVKAVRVAAKKAPVAVKAKAKKQTVIKKKAKAKAKAPAAPRRSKR